MAKGAGRGSSGGGYVYSTQHGELCPKCERPVVGCICRRMAAARAGTERVVRVGRETKGRKGKGVTLVTDVPLDDVELALLGKALKKKCGSGGTTKDGVIEIQGDHRDAIVRELEGRGWTVKRVGG